MNKKFSKVFAMLLVVSMLFSHILVPISADDDPTPGPDLNQDDIIEEIEQGLPDTICECDEEHFIPGGDEYVRPRDCVNYEVRFGTCLNCGGRYVIEVLDYPLGHDWSIEEVEEVPATCTEDGFAAHYECARCGAKAVKTFDEELQEDVYTICEDDEFILPALGHDDSGEWVIENEVPASCTEAGQYDRVLYCARENCGEELDRETIVTDPIDHDWEEISRQPNVRDEDIICTTEDIYVTYRCTECGAERDELIHEETVHDYGDQPIATYDADCFFPAREVYQCLVCGYILVNELGDALGHDLEWVEEEPTCTEDGILGHYHCNRCGMNFDEDGNVYIVSEGDLVAVPEEELELVIEEGEDPETGEPIDIETLYWNSDVAEVEVRYAEEDDFVDPALGHDYEGEWVIDEDSIVEPTCTEAGYYDEVLLCTRCGEELDRRTVEDDPDYEELGHDYEEVVTPATCIAEGYTTYTCSRCGDTYEDDFTPIDDLNGHDAYITIPAVQPTCFAPGHTEEAWCSLCHIQLRFIRELDPNPDNHSALRTIEGQEPTCEEGGWDEYQVCDDCHYVEEHEEYDALGHNFDLDGDEEDDWIEEIPATCTEDGVRGYYQCSRCGKLFVYDEGQQLVEIEEEDLVIPAYGHDTKETLGYVNPTCLDAGLIVEKCLRCGEFFRSENPDAPALGHDLVHVDAQDPTCTEIGWEAYDYCVRVCQNQITGEEFVCDYTTYVELPATGHTPAEEAEIENVDEPTCTEDGSHDEVIYCTVCGEELSRETVVDDALGHDFEWVEEVPATCTENGVAAHYECSRCGLLLDENEEEVEEDDLVIDELGHDYEEEVTEPTCEEGGYTTYTCSRCGDTYTDDETEALGHDLDEGVVTEPTCTEGGYTTYTCSRCGETFEDDYTDALGHLPGEPERDNVVEPTYDAPGSYDEVIRCERCGEILESEEGIEVPPLNEGIYFTYEATGIKGSTVAVNSGYVFVKVYMNVYTDIARFYGIDFALDFDEPLTLIAVTGCVFENGVTEYTGLELANNEHMVIIAQNMGAGFEQATFEEGTYLYATLVFKVADHYCEEDGIDDYYTAWIDFDYDYWYNIGRYGFVNDLDVGFDDCVAINVEMLGDADFIIRKLTDPEVGYGEYNDGRFTTIDAMALALWFANAEDEDAYETIFDMNKDGFIDGDDFVLLHTAIAGNYDYLELCGDYRDLI